MSNLSDFGGVPVKLNELPDDVFLELIQKFNLPKTVIEIVAEAAKRGLLNESEAYQ